MQSFHQQEAFDLTVACCDKKHFFNLNDVVRLEASSNYTRIHTVTNRPLLVAKVLSAYEEILESLGFIRVHRSHLVNSRFIHAVNQSGHLLLHDNSSVEISRRRRKAVMGKLKQL